MLLVILLTGLATAGEIIVANNTRITYDFGHEVKPYIANEFKLVNDGKNTLFDSNKFRIGARYKINDYVSNATDVYLKEKKIEYNQEMQK